MNKRGYLNKWDKLMLFYLIKDKITNNFIGEHSEVELIKIYLELVRYIELANKLHLDINELIDPEEYLTIKKFLLLKGYDIDD